MGETKHDSLAVCGKGNSYIELLDERAEIKRENALNAAYCNAGPRKWAERLAKMAFDDRNTADRMRELVAEIERIRSMIR